jgi:hypothetical protein
MSEPLARTSPSDAAAEIREYGSTVLRGAWRKEHLTTLRGAIVAFNEIRAKRVAAGLEPQGGVAYHEHGAGNFPMLVAHKLLQPSILSEMFLASAYHPVCVEYLQDDAIYVSPVRLAFRIHDPLKSDRSFVPFHQDSGTQDGRTRRVLNCWIPLDDGAGRVAPGLEVVRQPSEPNFPLKDRGAKPENLVYDRVAIDAERVVELYGDKLMAPTFELGDGFAFSQDVIHRTYVTPQMTRPRLNFEFRVFSLKHLAPGVSAKDVLQSAWRVA